MAERFTGFPPDGIRFLTFFDAHRRTYERDLAAPIRLFVADVADRLRASVAPALLAEPTVGKSLFRLNRDLHFTKDKTPYNPWVDAIWWEGHPDARQAPAFIFRLAADHVVVGARATTATAPLVRLDDPAREHRTVGLESLGGHGQAELIEPAELGQVRAGEGGARQVEVTNLEDLDFHPGDSDAQTRPEVRSCVTVRSGLLRVPAQIGQWRTR